MVALRFCEGGKVALPEGVEAVADLVVQLAGAPKVTCQSAIRAVLSSCIPSASDSDTDRLQAEVRRRGVAVEVDAYYRMRVVRREVTPVDAIRDGLAKVAGAGLTLEALCEDLHRHLVPARPETLPARRPRGPAEFVPPRAGRVPPRAAHVPAAPLRREAVVIAPRVETEQRRLRVTLQGVPQNVRIPQIVLAAIARIKKLTVRDLLEGPLFDGSPIGGLRMVAVFCLFRICRMPFDQIAELFGTDEEEVSQAYRRVGDAIDRDRTGQLLLAEILRILRVVGARLPTAEDRPMAPLPRTGVVARRAAREPEPPEEPMPEQEEETEPETAARPTPPRMLGKQPTPPRKRATPKPRSRPVPRRPALPPHEQAEALKACTRMLYYELYAPADRFVSASSPLRGRPLDIGEYLKKFVALLVRIAEIRWGELPQRPKVELDHTRGLDLKDAQLDLLLITGEVEAYCKVGIKQKRDLEKLTPARIQKLGRRFAQILVGAREARHAAA